MYITLSRVHTLARGHPAVWFTAIFALGFAVRASGLQSQSFTMDELAELTSGAKTVGQIALTRDGFPPLYGILLHGWLQAFGDDRAARWLSVVIGLLTIIAMRSLGRWAGGERVGLVAAAALALSPSHVWLSQEARPYVLYYAFAVLALWLYFRAMATNGRGDWLLFSVACVGGVYSHYYFALLLATTGLLLLLEKRGVRDLAPGLVAHGVLALACVPLIELLRADLAYQAGYRLEAPFSVVTLGYTYFSLIAGFTLGPSLRELHYLPTATAMREVLPWVVLVGASVLALCVVALVTLRPRTIALRLVVLATAPALLAGALAGFLGVGFRVRYVAWIAAPLLVLVAAGIVASRWRWTRSAATLLIASVWVIALVNRQTVGRYWNEDVRALARYLRSNARPTEPIFVMSEYMAIPVAYYLGDGWNVCALPSVDGPAADPDGPLRVVRSIAPTDSAFWFVYTRPFHSDSAGRVPEAFTHAGLIDRRTEFAGVTLYAGRARRLTTPFAPRACEPPDPQPGSGAPAGQ